LVLDMDAMKKVEANDVDTKDSNKEIDRMFGNLEDKTDICSKANIEITNNLSAIKKQDMGNCSNDGYDIGF